MDRPVHLSYKEEFERAGIAELGEEKAQGDLIKVYKYVIRGSGEEIKKTAPDFSQ